MNQKGLERRIKALVPGYLAMGETGMAKHAEHLPHMKGAANTLAMMTGKGPYGNIEMGGMFTVLKVRDDLKSCDEDPGWYRPPEGRRCGLESRRPIKDGREMFDSRRLSDSQNQ